MAVQSLLIEGYHGNLKYTDNDIFYVKQTFTKIDIATEIVSTENAHNVQQKVEDICSQAYQNDTLLIYYTGHAEIRYDKLLLKIANSGKHFSDFLAIEVIINALQFSKFTKAVLILDCCHAQKAGTGIPATMQEKIQVLYSSRQTEQSWEIDQLKMSAFSKFMCESLEDALRELDAGNKFSLSNLDERIRRKINNYNRENGIEIPKCGLIGSQTDETILLTARATGEAGLVSKITEYQNSFLTCIEECDGTCSGKFSWCDIFIHHNIDLKKYAIPTVKTKEGIPMKLNDFFKQWVASDDTYLALLANVGVGKTAACFHLVALISKGEIKGIFVPVLISLQTWEEIARKKDIYSVLVDFANNQFSQDEIKSLITSKQLMLILDGFDEMNAESTLKSIITNFKKLTPFLRLKCKTVLTCRTHYFAEESQIIDVLQGHVPGTDFAGLLLGDEYGFCIAELQEFSEDEIIEVIQLSMTTEDADTIWNEIKDIYDLRDLARRAIILKLILGTLPELKKHKNDKITEARLYKIYTYKLLKRELCDKRYRIEVDELEMFIEYIASLMWQHQILSINSHSFRREIEDFYIQKIGIPDAIDQYVYAGQVSSFFVRDKKDCFAFCHKSFFEYYFARYCIRTMRSEESGFPGWGKKWFDREIANFIADIVMFQNEELVVRNLLRTANQATDPIIIWNVLHILSLLDEKLITEWMGEQQKSKLINKAKSETNCVIIRQYCRIIARFIDRTLAEQLIDKIIKIVESDPEQNSENNETYFNYYAGRDAACNAFVNHLRVKKPKYDAKLHIYLLGNIAGEEYIDSFLNSINLWEKTEYDKYSEAVEHTISCMKKRSPIGLQPQTAKPFMPVFQS